jgi:ubiquinone/menaquinone biosynthesis C-methylase UbiE
MSLTFDNAGRAVEYELGHAERELERLDHQAQLVGPFTLQVLRDAGIRPGMRVLDVGSGAGHVALLAADLVGPAGEVVGTDKAAAAVAAAQARAKTRALRQLSFREGDPAAMTFEPPFDAVIGRYVLMFQTDPVAMLRSLARHLRPGGVIVFHEPDWTGARSLPPAPTYDRCNHGIVETFKRLGTETRMGAKLYAAFVAAGLPGPAMREFAIIGGGSGAAPWLHQIAELVRTLLPEMERTGVARAAEVDIETLAERLDREVTAGGGTIIGRSEIGAWSHV